MRLSNVAIAMLNKCAGHARAAARGIVAGALPSRCALCVRAAGAAGLCGDCAASIAAPADACPGCALPSAGALRCGRCLAHPPAWDAAIAAGAYAFPLDRLVMRLKYAGELPYAAALGACLARAAAAAGAVSRVDALVPVPLAAARQRERGFNQASEIARAVAAGSGLPVVDVLHRVRDAAPQASLARRDRERNLRGAFVARDVPLGARLALIDDVMTSGSTAAAAAGTLRAAGAARVEAWVVARTPPA